LVQLAEGAAEGPIQAALPGLEGGDARSATLEKSGRR
jgi:hypothetical protein